VKKDGKFSKCGDLRSISTSDQFAGQPSPEARHHPSSEEKGRIARAKPAFLKELGQEKYVCVVFCVVLYRSGGPKAPQWKHRLMLRNFYGQKEPTIHKLLPAKI